MGDRCLDYLEHAGWRYLWSLGRNQVILLCLNLEVMAEGRLEANVVEWGHLVSILHFSSIKDGPLCKLCDRVAALLVSLVLLNTHLAVAFERKEVAFTRLQAHRRSKSDWLVRVAILKVQQRQFFAFAHF